MTTETETDVPTPEALIEADEPPTPEIIAAWSDDDVDRYNELKEQDLREDMVDERKRQEEALQEIAAGEEIEKFDDVELGNLEIEVKAWLPGTVEQTVSEAQRIADTDDMHAIRESMETMLTALSEMTTSEDYNRTFWTQYYDRYGPEGMLVAVQTILAPAAEEMEAKQEAVDGFREGVEGPRPGAGSGTERTDTS